MYACRVRLGVRLPYGGKLWRMETLADLANDHKFAKVSSAKILCSILNNIIINIQIRQSLFRQLYFYSKFAKVCTHQSFPLYGTLFVSVEITRSRMYGRYVRVCCTSKHIM